MCKSSARHTQPWCVHTAKKRLKAPWRSQRSEKPRLIENASRTFSPRSRPDHWTTKLGETEQRRSGEPVDCSGSRRTSKLVLRVNWQWLKPLGYHPWPTGMVMFSWKSSIWSINNFEPYPSVYSIPAGHLKYIILILSHVFFSTDKMLMLFDLLILELNGLICLVSCFLEVWD